ncbi:hypothetical protein GCM10010166_44970 [Couchioplanes caeruleus subsp. azureus]|nr:hypothetical protein GCM10010166_44970 [Couchioplanes caeruleus subsp. azureus]
MPNVPDGSAQFCDVPPAGHRPALCDASGGPAMEATGKRPPSPQPYSLGGVACHPAVTYGMRERQHPVGVAHGGRREAGRGEALHPGRDGM